ncbi:MAG TPA: DNA-directed RNA polymerase subunit alpha, partial [Alphaproteobacteria bacterium]|nr:DNA-directed RNA polymerase subunit alpha [Alphaproteobacteria bacterium]
MIEKNWQELIKPSKIQIDAGNDPKRKATIVVEPLERGFGLTLGNALRRVLLSSLQGAAIVGMKAEGVVHEFSSLEGVREDVTDIILNLKAVVVKLGSGERKRVTVDIEGPCEVTAGMLEENADIEYFFF